jgi:anti-anti-sigma factor
MDDMHFTFADTIAGYVTTPADTNLHTFGLKTIDGREFTVKLTNTTYGEILRNLGESFQDPGTPLENLIKPDRYLFASGLFYHEGGQFHFEAKHIIFPERQPGEYRFEEPDWWITQIRALADFYYDAQFPNGIIDYRNYRTDLTVEGQKILGTHQETDTISRLIYGFATAYMLTGEDRYLKAAEKGTEYLREHMRSVNDDDNTVIWYHGVDIQGTHERKILASDFGDDYDAVPAYEQIYALVGPIQTYRITGDPRILRDAKMTLNLFNKYFLDREKGGFFSHIDPVTLDPRAQSLGNDQARKNWNSVGDHAPAYLINLWLATGENKYADLLVTLADTIVQHFPDFEQSPFVQERFYEDWSHDKTWGWQQNRAVVGHNLKIAWNLMRIHHLRPNESYTALARKIATLMPQVGMDLQRGGWYDVVERELLPGEEWHRFVWHDRKAWWQQEQAILAYLILHGSLKEPADLHMARTSSAFYNAFFLDLDNGGVYFNVLSTGIPYLLGTERLKGSHSMASYHSFELCYLATVYTNLLIKKQPMDLYFKPQPGVLKDNILRVLPDILPAGSVRIEAVWINGVRHYDFNAEEMTITLPSLSEQHPLKETPAWTRSSQMKHTTKKELRVKVRLAPTGVTFDSELEVVNGTAMLTLFGNLDNTAEPLFKKQLDKIIAAHPKHVVLRMESLQTMSRESARELAFACQKLSVEENIYAVGTQEDVKQILKSTGVWEVLLPMDTFDAKQLGLKEMVSE